MNVQEIAERWGVHYNTVFKLIREGDLEARPRKYRSQGIQVSKEEVRAYEEARGVPEDPIRAKEAMERIGCSRHLLTKYVDLGLLRAGRIYDSGRLYFSKEEVEKVRRLLNEDN